MANLPPFPLAPEDQAALNPAIGGWTQQRINLVHGPLWLADPDVAMGFLQSTIPNRHLAEVTRNYHSLFPAGPQGPQGPPQTFRPTGVRTAGFGIPSVPQTRPDTGNLEWQGKPGNVFKTLPGWASSLFGIDTPSNDEVALAKERYGALDPQDRAQLEKEGYDFQKYVLSTTGPEHQQVNLPKEVTDALEHAKTLGGDPNAAPLTEREKHLLRVNLTLYPPENFTWHGVDDSILSRFIGEPVSSIIGSSNRALDLAVGLPAAGVAFANRFGVLPNDYRERYKQLHNGEEPPAPSIADTFYAAQHPEGAGQAFGKMWADAWGIQREDPGYDQFVGLTSVVGQLYFSPDILAANVARGVKLGAATINGYRETQAAAEAAAAAGAWERAAELKGQAEAILNSVSRSYLTRAAFDKVARTTQEVIYSDKGYEISSKIRDVVNGGAGGSELARTIKGLPQAAADSLARAKPKTPEDVQQIMMAWSKGESDISLAKAQEELGQINKGIKDLDSVAAGHTLEGRAAIDDLVTRRHVLKARVEAAVAPTLDTIRELPKNSKLHRVINEAPLTRGEEVWSHIANNHWKVPVIGKVADYSGKIRVIGAEIDAERRILEHPTASEAEKGRALTKIDDLEAQLRPLLEKDGKRQFITARQASPSLSKIWDQNWDRRLWVHTSNAKRMPPDALEWNLKQVESFMKASGVPVAARNEVLDLFMRAKNDSDFYRALKKVGQKIEDSPLISRNAAQRLDPHARTELTRFFKTTEESQKYGLIPFDAQLPGGGVINSAEPVLPVLRNGKTRGIPGGPSEMISYVALPSVDEVLNSVSYSRKLRQAVLANPDAARSAKVLSGVAEYGIRFNRAATRLWKDFIILSRAFGAFQARVIGEENLRMWAYDQAGAFTSPGEWWSYVKRQEDLPEWLDGRMLGHIETKIREDYLRGGKEIYSMGDAYHSKALSSRYAQLHSEPLVREIAASGPEEAKKWLAGHDGWETRRIMEANIKEHLEWLKAPEGGNLPNATIQDAWNSYVDRKWQEIQALTNEDPELLSALANGRISFEDMDALKTERSRLQTEYQKLNNDYYSSGNTQTALAKRMHDTRSRLKEIDQKMNPKNLERDIMVGSDDFAQYIDTRKILDRMDFPQVGGWQPEKKGAHIPSTMRNWMYDHLISKPDSDLARKPLWRQFRDKEYTRLKGLGWDEKTALERASLYAARQTSDVLYDLAQRTSAQRFFQGIAPFAPAWQELLETYAWKIPAQFYPGIGHLWLLRHGQLTMQALSILGIDPTKAYKVPFVSDLLGAIPGLGGSTEFTFYPSSLSLATGGSSSAGAIGLSGPGLGPVGNVALGQLAKMPGRNVFDSLSDYLQPFGPDATIAPNSINRIIEGITGKPSFLEFASSDTQELKFGFAYQTALNQVYKERRKTIPKWQDFTEARDQTGMTEGEVAAFTQATAGWVKDTEHRAQNRVRAWSLTQGILDTMFPASVHTTTIEKDAYTQLNETMFILAGIAEGGDLTLGDKEKLAAFRKSAAGQALYDQYLKDHPGAEMFMTPNSYTAIMADHLPGTDAENRAYSSYLSGKRVPLSDDERIALTFYFDSRRTRDARIAAIEQKYGGTGDPKAVAQKIVQNYGAFRDEMLQEGTKWAAYEGSTGAPGKAVFDKLVSASETDRPEQTIGQDMLLEFLGNMNEVLPLLEVEGQVGKPEGYTDLKRFVSQQLEQVFKDHPGVKPDPVLQAIYDYQSTTLADYYDQTDPIWRQIDDTPKAEQGPLFDQLRHIANAQVPRDGWPTPEQYAYASKSEDEQQAQVAQWATRPPEWLTKFQLEQLGVTVGPAQVAFLDKVNMTNDQVKAIGREFGYGSNAYQDAKDQAEAYLSGQAVVSGSAALWNLSQEPAAVRLAATNYPAPPVFDQLAQQSSMMWTLIDAAGYSPSGTSEVAVAYQNQLYAQINQLRTPGSDLDTFFNNLELALAPAGKAKRPKQDLYAALFFDQWNGAQTGFGPQPSQPGQIGGPPAFPGGSTGGSTTPTQPTGGLPPFPGGG